MKAIRQTRRPQLMRQLWNEHWAISRKSNRRRRRRRLAFEPIEPRRLLASDIFLPGADYQSDIGLLDVDESGFIEAMDALMVAIAIDDGDGEPPSTDSGQRGYPDVSGDGVVSQADFDAIVDFLNQVDQPTPAVPIATTQASLGSVFEGEAFRLNVALSEDIGYVEVDWGDGVTMEYYDATEPIEYTYYDDDPTATPQDDYVVTVTSYSILGNPTLSTGVIRVYNVSPTANEDHVTISENDSTVIDVLANDIDPGIWDTVAIDSIDTNGTIGRVSRNSDGTITYDTNGQFDHLARGETATDVFSYVAIDDDGGKQSSIVVVTIEGEPEIYRLDWSISGDAEEENEVPAVVTFRLDQAAPAGGMSVNWQPFTPLGGSDAHAADPSDFSNAVGSVTIPEGETEISVELRPIDDQIVEMNESLTLEVPWVSNNSHILMSSPPVQSTTVWDDEWRWVGPSRENASSIKGPVAVEAFNTIILDSSLAAVANWSLNHDNQSNLSVSGSIFATLIRPPGLINQQHVNSVNHGLSIGFVCHSQSGDIRSRPRIAGGRVQDSALAARVGLEYTITDNQADEHKVSVVLPIEVVAGGTITTQLGGSLEGSVGIQRENGPSAGIGGSISIQTSVTYDGGVTLNDDKGFEGTCRKGPGISI